MKTVLGYTPQFWTLCLSTFLFFTSFNMVIPELPNYLSQLGGAEYKGLIISLFTLMAMLSRPLSGKLTDVTGRKPVMIIGAVIGTVVSALYPIFTSVFGFLMLRFVHGASTGFNPTGVSAYIADIIPAHMRGRAMGVLGVFTSTGFAFGPSIGPYISGSFGLNALFYTSSAFALIAGLVVLGMKETLPDPAKPSKKNMTIRFRDFFEPRVAAPTIYFMLSTYSFGGILTIIPDFSDHLGLENRGLFFTVFVSASLLVRLAAGKMSDTLGRVNMLRGAAVILITALVTLSMADSRFLFITSGILYGIGVGINSPTVFAWTVDLADEKFRGRAMATLYIGLEIGIGAGAMSMAAIYGNTADNFTRAFISAGIFSLASLIVLFLPLAKRNG